MMLILVLFLIVIAIFLPIISMIFSKTKFLSNKRLVTLVSFICALFALFHQMFAVGSFLKDLNYTGLMDTAPYMSSIYLLFAGIIIILNVTNNVMIKERK